LNWEALGAVAELLGALGVIASLIYLAVQIRQNTTAVRSSTYQALTDSSMNFSALVAGDPSLTLLFDLGMSDFLALDHEEQVRFGFLMQSYVRMLENSFHQHRDGMLDEERWVRPSRTLKNAATQPGFVQWWQSSRTPFSPAFEAYVREEIESGA
jgi:hypothetical protein